MDRRRSEAIRNVALIAHSGAGKTSLTEAMAHLTSRSSRLGRVEEGNTISDFDPDEAERGMSINLAVVPCEWRGRKINVVDTPGYPDFAAEVVSGLRAADAAIVLIDAASGVEVGTEIVWRLADRQSCPRLVVVNRMDRENVVWESVIQGLRDQFGPAITPIQIPVGEAPAFDGMVDLLDGKARMFTNSSSDEGPVPDGLQDSVDAAREQLVEAVAATDDDLLEKYLDGKEIERDDLERALRAGIQAGDIYPVMFTAATALRGVNELLNAIATLLPSPVDLPIDVTENGSAIEASPDGPVVAQVFKTLADAFVGNVSLLRVFTGTITGDCELTNQTGGLSERLSGFQHPVGKEGIRTGTVVTGDIAFVTKLENVATGDTLVSTGASHKLAPLNMPTPLFEAAIRPKTQADLDKMGQALSRISEEDPSLQVRRDDQTGETILAGLGESHVQISLERIRRKFNVSLLSEIPRVAYRETIRKTVNAHGRHKRQSGGRGQFGDVHIEFSPLARGSGFEYEDRIKGGSIPRQYLPAVEKGLVECFTRGTLAGYPVVDLKAAVFDGQYHDVDSSDEAFRNAARLAFEDGYRQAGPVILEPIVKLAILIPDGNTGDVIGDISARRGHVLGISPSEIDSHSEIEVEVAEAEVQRYATDLRSMTQGRGQFTREFMRYQEVPPHVQERLVAETAAERG
jgi:elongation factor G